MHIYVDANPTSYDLINRTTNKNYVFCMKIFFYRNKVDYLNCLYVILCPRKKNQKFTLCETNSINSK
jgi:hypothetical protein